MNQSNPAAFTTIYQVSSILHLVEDLTIPNLFQCALLVGVESFTPVSDCFNNEGDEILAKLGDQTHAVEPTITFVPTIVYNDVFDQNLQDTSLTDFAGVACALLNTSAPASCTVQVL